MVRGRSALWLAGLVLLVIALFLTYQQVVTVGQPVVIHQTAVPPLPSLDSEKVAMGESLYTPYCAKCHGAHLEGSPNWQEPLPDGSLLPPPHDSAGHTWHHSDELLISITENGGDPAYHSKMPAFKDQLSREEIAAIFDFIKSKWDREKREYQWWITMRPRP